MGGTGNQLFQYALGKSLEARGREIYYDRSLIDADPKRNYSLDKFGLNLQFSEPVGRLVRERNMYFDSSIFFLDNCTLEGYWQCEKYFECVAPFLREELIESNEKNDDAFVHVRRGDNCYGAGLTYHGLLDFDYFMNGIGYLENKVKPNHYYIFSDDTKWCKEHFSDSKITVIEGNSDYQDLQLMARCRYGIIANSSYSWWGAYLGNCDVVVAPRRWYISVDEGDTVPKSWVRL